MGIWWCLGVYVNGWDFMSFIYLSTMKDCCSSHEYPTCSYPKFGLWFKPFNLYF